jgi:hypothetical protein
MENSHYQLATRRIEENPKLKLEYLLCMLCKNTLWVPEKCRGCNTHFCKFCIEFHRLKTKNCPMCGFEYIRTIADHFLNEDLNSLKVKCIYNFNGCNKIMDYQSVRSHEEECVYKEKLCEECNSKILKKNYHTHIVLCKESLTDNLTIDMNQIIIYFQEKLEKLEKENIDDIERLRKIFFDSYEQKESTIRKLLSKMEHQQHTIEEIVKEREKIDKGEIFGSREEKKYEEQKSNVLNNQENCMII